MEAITSVGLSERSNHFPTELSGGEAQRAAFARAVAKQPCVLFADEPTGNLDAVNRNIILDLISSLHKQGQTIIMVTHDEQAARRASHRVVLNNMKIIQANCD